MPKMIGRMAPPKAAKPITAKAAVKMPDMSTAAVLARAERMQRAEASESRMVRRNPNVISTTTNYRATPAKKGK